MTSTNPAGPDPPAEAPLLQSRVLLRIVAEYDAAPKNERGAILRRERLYHSHVKESTPADGTGTSPGTARGPRCYL
ncbi:hypothetical protein [Streptomyces sp. NPDC006863]|uniref:hypothetical protein n=1 Tax=unclassified Streptomyces TaxID=2593676 RepID=UPI0033E1F145